VTRDRIIIDEIENGPVKDHYCCEPEPNPTRKCYYCGDKFDKEEISINPLDHCFQCDQCAKENADAQK
jgi:hypothetical protein